MRIIGMFESTMEALTLQRGGTTNWRRSIALVAVLASAMGIALAQHDRDDAFLPNRVQTAKSFTTVPTNGDGNPYGVAFVPENFQSGSGPLESGDILVSNFNNSQNLQGTGTTIVTLSKHGAAPTFFQGTAPLGLSTALGILRKGFIVVGNAPTLDGSSATAGAGSLLVIDNQGHLIQTFASASIQGPWDMALVDGGDTAIAFVSNALTGTVIRMDFKVGFSGLTLLSTTTIASGYVHRGDPVTLFVAPTGLVYDGRFDVLYVASSGDNAVYAVADAAQRHTNAGLGTVIYQDSVHLHGPLGMAMAPNGHLLVSNNDGINADANQPSEIVEFTIGGKFVKQLSVDPAQGGAFGLAVRTDEDKAIFAAVDDNIPNIYVWTLHAE